MNNPKPPCHIHDKVESNMIEEIRKDVCVNDEDFTKHTDGKHYCFFHLPTKEKDSAKFNEIFQARVEKTDWQCAEFKVEFSKDKENETLAKENGYKSYNFSYVWFPSEIGLVDRTFKLPVNFSNVTFTSEVYFRKAIFTAHADFSNATFTSNTNFSEAEFEWDSNFNSAKFLAVTTFEEAQFGMKGKAQFYQAVFEKDVIFNKTDFKGDVQFMSAIFGKVSDIFFRETLFAKIVDFSNCKSEGYLRFSNLRQDKDSKFDFEEAAFEKACRLSFHTCRMRPYWFINVDPRKFVFTEIDWGKSIESGIFNKNIKAELKSLGKNEQDNHLLGTACRQLAVNAEDNNRYEESAKFRYMAMEIRRLDSGWRRFLNLHWFYKWTSGYGESWSRAASVLVVVLLGFGLLYESPLASFEVSEKKSVVGELKETGDKSSKPEVYKMNYGEGFVHSLYVATLQRPEPKAHDTRTKLFVILETIFAPLQAALLALAIRRKFMR